MDTKVKCRIFCMLEGLISCIIVTLLILKFSVIYSAATVLVVCGMGYFREKMLPVFSMHEQIMWSAGPSLFFLIAAYAIFQKTLLLVCAVICLVLYILEWKYDLFRKRH